MSDRSEQLKTFSEHLQEFRGLMLVPLLVLVIVSVIAFINADTIISIIQKPLAKTLYYSSPMGGFTFIFSLSAIVGLLASLPVLMRSLIKFLEPTMKKITTQKVALYVTSSIVLAILGVYCGYRISLPAALHFLNGFESGALKPLIAADQYLRFALLYLGGFALLFQLPLIVLIINRIKPLKPSKLMKYQRYVIAGSFILAAFLTPTPDIVNQAIFAAPMILLYQLSIVMVWLTNKLPKKFKEVKQDLKLDLPHPIGAIYTPQPITVHIPVREARRRPIDVILSSQLAL